MDVVEKEGSDTKVYFVGNSMDSNGNDGSGAKILISGIEVSRGAIESFSGFGNVVDSASATESDKTESDENTGKNSNKLLPIIAGAAGGLVCILGAVSLIVLRSKRSANSTAGGH